MCREAEALANRSAKTGRLAAACTARIAQTDALQRAYCRFAKEPAPGWAIKLLAKLK